MSFFHQLTTQRLTAVLLIFLIFVMAVRVPADTDVWWHIRSGEFIVKEQTIPHTDPFSYTRQGEKWIDHSWGSQIIIYGVYHLFGGDTEPGSTGNIGLALYTAVLATLGMWFVYQMCEGTVYLRAFIMVLGTAAAAVFWSPRPQMFSFVLGAATLYILHLYKRRQVDRLWIIPLLMIIWANLHGGFAIGFIFLFGTIFGEVLGHIMQGEAVISWIRLRKLVIVTVASMVAVCVNPYGVQMLAYPFRTVGIGVLQDYIQEWATPNFHQPQAWPFALLLLGGFAAVGVSGKRIDWTDLTLFVGTGLMALLAGRNIAVFTIVATPIVTRHLNAWLEDHGWQIHPARRVRGTLLILNWALLVLVMLAGFVKIAAALNHKTIKEAQEEMLPVEITRYLAQTPPDGHMFNSYNWGGYLMFAAPDLKVYVDGRTDLYDDAFLRDYLDIAFAKDGWDQALDAQQIGYVVIEADSMLAKLLRTQPDRWQEQQFDDGDSALFTRSEAAQ